MGPGRAFVYFDTVDNASRARSQISGMVIDGCGGAPAWA